MTLFGRIRSEKVHGTHRSGEQSVHRPGWTDSDQNQSDETSCRGQATGRHPLAEELYVGLVAT
jgi:hypothetical protein